MDQLQLDIDPDIDDISLLEQAGYDDLLEPEPRDYTGIRTRQMKLFY